MKQEILKLCFYTNEEINIFRTFFRTFAAQAIKLLPDLHGKLLSLAAAFACLHIFSSPEGILQQPCLEQVPPLNKETYLVRQI